MTKLSIKQAQLIKLWQRVQPSAQVRSKDFGDVALQYYLAESFGLIEILDYAAYKRDQGMRVGLATLFMAIHRNSDPGSKLSFLEWYPNTILPELTGLSGEEVAYHDLLSSMDYWNDEAIGKAEKDMLFELGNTYGIGLHTLIWDSSSCYFDAQVNEMVKFGHSRDHRPDRPQVGTDMFIDPQTGVVPYARSYEGNVVDATRFPQAIGDLQRQYPKLTGLTILVDRGAFSEKNLVLLKDLEYSVIAGVSQLGRWASMTEDVSTFDTRFNFKGTRWAAQIENVSLQGCEKEHSFFVHIYFDHKKAKKEHRLRQKALKACQEELEGLRLGKYKLKNREQIKTRVNALLQQHKVKPFLSVKVVKPRGQDQFHLEIAPKKRALSKADKRDGRFALITDREELTSKEVLIEYRSKEKVESAFSILKGPVSLRPVFHYNPQRIKAHVFICYLALFLRNLLDLILKAKDIDPTPNKALKKAKKIRITEVYFQDSEYTFWIPNHIDPEVQKIFDAVGFNPQQILKSAGLSPP